MPEPKELSYRNPSEDEPRPTGIQILSGTALACIVVVPLAFIILATARDLYLKAGVGALIPAFVVVGIVMFGIVLYVIRTIRNRSR